MKSPNISQKPLKSLQNSRIPNTFNEMNAYIPDFFLKTALQKTASKAIFAKTLSPIKKLARKSLESSDFEKISWEHEENALLSNEDLQKLEGLLETSRTNGDFPTNFAAERFSAADPLSYYQGFRINNFEKVKDLQPRNYVKEVAVSQRNASFLSEDEVFEAKFVNFEKEPHHTRENSQRKPGFAEIDQVFADFCELRENVFEDYERIAVNSEEYDNIIAKKRQNHASFAFISLTFLKKLLRKFFAAVRCLEETVKAWKILPKLATFSLKTLSSHVKTLTSSRNFEFCETQAQAEGFFDESFAETLRKLEKSLQTLQKTVNKAKVLHSSLSSSKRLESSSSKKVPISPKPLQFAEILEKLASFQEMQKLLLNLLNLNYKQNFAEDSEALLKQLQEKDDNLNEKTEREINYNKSEYIVTLLAKSWTLYTENIETFSKLHSQYSRTLQQALTSCDNLYYKYFNIYQKLSLSLESLRKLSQLSSQKINVLELQTQELFEKSLIKLQFPLHKHAEFNKKTLQDAQKLREKLEKKVQKAKKHAKLMQKNVKNDFFSLFFLQKCEEALQKLSQLLHKLSLFSEFLHIFSEFAALERFFQFFCGAFAFETASLDVLQRNKREFLEFLQKVKVFKGVVQFLKPSFPVFYELDKEIAKNTEILELRLRQIQQELQGKSPEFLKLAEKDLESSQASASELRLLFNSSSAEASLHTFLHFLEKNPGIDSELGQKLAQLQRFSQMRGLQLSKKQAAADLLKEMQEFHAFFVVLKVFARVFLRFALFQVKPAFNSLNILEVCVKGNRETFSGWLQEIEKDLQFLERESQGIIREFFTKERVFEVFSSLQEVFRKVLAHFQEMSEFFAENRLNLADFNTKTDKLLQEAAHFLEKLAKLDKNLTIFAERSQEIATPAQIQALLHEYIATNSKTFANQSGNYLKMQRNRSLIDLNDKLLNLQAFFLEKGLQEFLETKLNEATAVFRDAKSQRNDFKQEVLRAQNQGEGPTNSAKIPQSSLEEVKETVSRLDSVIKNCVFLLSVAGLGQLFARELKQIKHALRNSDNMALTVSQKIKEFASECHAIRKKLKSSKKYLPQSEFPAIFSQTEQLLEQTVNDLSVVYEILGDLNSFDSVFCENEFTINALSEDFCDALGIFLEFQRKFPQKKKQLLANRENLYASLTNAELKETAKLFDAISVSLFGILQEYLADFDVDFLEFLRPKLKIVNKRWLLQIQADVDAFLELFEEKTRTNIQETGKILSFLQGDLQRISQEIKETASIFESDLSYKSFLKLSSRNLEKITVNKMLVVEGLAECKNLFVKEKLNGWESIFSNCYEIINSYLEDKARNTIKSLGEYRQNIFLLKKAHYRANKEMNFLNALEEVVSFDVKNGENVY